MKKSAAGKVLVVSHDAGTARAYMAIAKSGGWIVAVCENDGSILDAIRDHTPDALIVDYSPDSGLGALRKVREVGFRLPTILITTHPVDEAVMMELGVKVILPKPPSITRLRETLKALTAAPFPASDMKVLFQFLERCDAPHRRQGGVKPPDE